MYELEPTEYDKVKPVFQTMKHHLAVNAIIEGVIPATVYVDKTDHPRSACTWVKHRFYVAGSEKNDIFTEGIKKLFTDTLYPQIEDGGVLVLYYTGNWEDKIGRILKDKHPIKAQRHFYTFKKSKNDWRAVLPEGVTIQFVDKALLKRNLKNIDTLTEEMCSERQSVKDFLDKSFGICLIHNDEIVGWCLSEYNSTNCCEIGIETVKPHRKRGFATITASALIEHALSTGVSHIGWHCYADNEPSVATARKVGFQKVMHYPVYLVWGSEVESLAQNGYFCFKRQQYEKALLWYEKAITRGADKAWVFWDAARAAAVQGYYDAAISYLNQAVNKGFTTEHIKNSEHLKGLHGTKEWKALIERLDGQ